MGWKNLPGWMKFGFFSSLIILTIYTYYIVLLKAINGYFVIFSIIILFLLLFLIRFIHLKIDKDSYVKKYILISLVIGVIVSIPSAVYFNSDIFIGPMWNLFFYVIDITAIPTLLIMRGICRIIYGIGETPEIIRYLIIFLSFMINYFMVGLVYGKLKLKYKMNWENWPGWLKGGFMAVIISILVLIYMSILSSIFHSLYENPFYEVLLIISIVPGMLIELILDSLGIYFFMNYGVDGMIITSVVLWIIIGALIGFIYDKIKSKSKKNET